MRKVDTKFDLNIYAYFFQNFKYTLFIANSGEFPLLEL